MINLIVSLLLTSAFAQSNTSTSKLQKNTTQSKVDDESIYVIGSKEDAFYTPGSAHFIDQKELEVFDYQDVSRVLDKVPGVYIQEEDGLGLRPNIGLRGAHPHRSKKVTLMEDGVLIAPAPYASPAAYYFPSTSRISSMEVYKGPSSVKYGPNSIGGAINMVTRPMERGATVEISGGSFLQTHAYGSTGNFLVEGVHKEGELVKTLTNGQRLEFYQNDLLIKNFQKFGAHKISTKFSFANEESDETYLGISGSDYNTNPFTRYSASQDDKMKWQRWAAQLTYQRNLTSYLDFKTSLYHHQMDRNWTKFNNVGNSNDFKDSLNTGVDPNNLIGLLKGERDSTDSNEFLQIGANDRRYYSQGIQSQGNFSFDTGKLGHELAVGIRVHRDQVRRNHATQMAAMVNGDLIYQEDTFTVSNKNQDTSFATAIFVEDEMIYNDLSVKVGFRAEQVEHERDSRTANPEVIENTERIFVPGVGMNYSITDNFVVLGGVNKGVTLVGPGQESNVDPEEAINYELGVRANYPVQFEAVGFYSDYSNLVGTCSFSSGCAEENLDTEFNGGKAEVYGLEMGSSYVPSLKSWSFPLKLSYTYTVARFKTDFTNSNPEWGPEGGEIRVNDPMPYIPQSQINFGVGAKYGKFTTNFNFLWKGQMADQAVAENRQFVPSYGVIDTSFSYQYLKKGKVFLRVNNMLDNTYLVSYRPFGARPGAPRTFSMGLQQRF